MAVGITFPPGLHSLSMEGASFAADIKNEFGDDVRRIVCHVSHEALDDINPDSRFDEPLEKFRDNLAELHRIAFHKIRRGEIENEHVYICSKDVR